MASKSHDDDEERDERDAAVTEVAGRLRDRGIAVTGAEDPGDLASLLEAVERFEAAVEAHGREPGFFQGAMYVSYALGIGEAFVLALAAMLLLAPVVGLPGAIAAVVIAHLACVPLLFRYSRVIWAHANIGTLDARDPARLAA